MQHSGMWQSPPLKGRLLRKKTLAVTPNCDLLKFLKTHHTQTGDSNERRNATYSLPKSSQLDFRRI